MIKTINMHGVSNQSLLTLPSMNNDASDYTLLIFYYAIESFQVFCGSF